MRLTDLTIKALPAPGQGTRVYYDDIVTGFGVRVTKAGAKSFVLTHGSRRHRETIGRVGIVPLQEARKAAKELLASYTLGRHKPRAMAWNLALAEYLEEVKANRRESTHYEYSRVLKRHFPFGDVRMTEIDAHDVQRDLTRLKGAPAEYHHAYITLRAFIRWAHRKHYIDKNPMERMQPPPHSKPRERTLTDDELKKVWTAAGDGTFGRIVKELVLTGQREGEICHLTALMIGENAITLPAWLTKNHRQHVFPIGTMAQKLLPTGSNAKGPYLFPARTSSSKPFSGFSRSKAALDAASGVKGWVLHDLRRTYASGLASLGVALPVIERLLNHVSGSFGGIVGVYQRYDFMPEMKSAVKLWDEHIQKLVQS